MIELYFIPSDHELGDNIDIAQIFIDSDDFPDRIEVRLMDGIQFPDICSIITHEYVHYILDCFGEEVANDMFDNISVNFLESNSVITLIPSEAYI